MVAASCTNLAKRPIGPSPRGVSWVSFNGQAKGAPSDPTAACTLNCGLYPFGGMCVVRRVQAARFPKPSYKILPEMGASVVPFTRQS